MSPVVASSAPTPFAAPVPELSEGWCASATFVEGGKNAQIAEGAKVKPPKSYIGDATIGAKANIGAGTNHLQTTTGVIEAPYPYRANAFNSGSKHHGWCHPCISATARMTGSGSGSRRM